MFFFHKHYVVDFFLFNFKPKIKKILSHAEIIFSKNHSSLAKSSIVRISESTEYKEERSFGTNG